MSWMKKPTSRVGQDNASRIVRAPSKRSLRLPNLIDEETGWYRAWYFMARLEEAIEQAGVSKDQLTLVRGSLPLSKWGEDSRLRIYTTIRLGLIEREARQVETIFGRLSEDEFAVCIPGSQEATAAASVRKAVRQLTALSVDVGMARFPEDGRDMPTLIAAARRGDVRSTNMVDLESYRRSHGPRVA